MTGIYENNHLKELQVRCMKSIKEFFTETSLPSYIEGLQAMIFAITYEVPNEEGEEGEGYSKEYLRDLTFQANLIIKLLTDLNDNNMNIKRIHEKWVSVT